MNSTPMSHQSEFTIRTFQFRELALQYFPASTPDTASKAFRRMINSCKGLPEAMAEKGFLPKGKTLSPILVEAIVLHLGRP
jgi:hypothetical protein